MTLKSWEAEAAVSYDRALLDELASLRFVEDANNALILGPVVMATDCNIFGRFCRPRCG